MSVLYSIVVMILQVVVCFFVPYYLPLKQKKWAVGILCILIMIPAIIYIVLPKDKLIHTVKSETLDSGLSSVKIEDLTNETFDPNRIAAQEQWQSEYYGDTLTIRNDSGLRTVVTYKNTSDHLLDITYFAVPDTYEQYDILSQLKPPLAGLSGDSLSLKEPPKYSIAVSRFNSDFTMQQFIKELRVSQDFIDIGHRYFVIRLPQNIKLSKNSYVDVL